MKEFYTYVYKDPKTLVPIYVGKGCGCTLAFSKKHSGLMTGRSTNEDVRKKMSDSHKARGGFSEEHKAAIKLAAQARGLRQRQENAARKAVEL